VFIFTFAIEPLNVLASLSSIKIWFVFVGKSFPWNALKVVRIDHCSYLQSIANIKISRQFSKTFGI
jgi:hypothetical protein